MAWLNVKLPITKYGDYESGVAHCPIHGDTIYTNDTVNKCICDFCGDVIKYGGCSTCITNTGSYQCDICGKNYCHKHGAHVYWGSARVSFRCKDHMQT